MRLQPVVCLTLLLLSPATLRADVAGTWTVRDVAAQGDWGNTAGLRLDAHGTSADVTDDTGHDRAVTLAYVIKLPRDGWTWWDDPDRSRPVSGPVLYRNVIDTNCGDGGVASLYPMAVMSNGTHVLVLSVPPTPARMVRFVYDAKRQELRAEFDFGLSLAAGKARADAAVATFEFDSRWPFRAAIERYWHAYPDAFARRPNTPEGIWLPFGDVRTIDRPEDFGIRAHECADHQVRGPDAKPFCDADAKAGCQTFPYVEPPTYWQEYRGDKSAGYDQRLKQLEDEAEHGSAVARATLVSGIIAADGRRDLYLGKVAYTTQAPWGSDADPAIPANARGWLSKGQWEMQRLGELLGWSKDPDPGVDGVYVDSLEGWGTIQDYARDHWNASRFPLTFDPTTKRVCLWNFWGTYSFVEQMARKLHADGKLLMANDAYYHFWYAAPYVDIPGREYTWTDKAGRLAPVPDDRYLFFKTMAGRRPYLMLMNNRYEDASIMEPYFERSLFFAVYPSMFQGHTAMGETAYFSNPAWYNRDRALFKKYIPLIRDLDRAGWQPVPHAHARPERIGLERYGEFAKGTLAFTLHNPTDAPHDVSVELDPAALGLPPTIHAHERIADRSVAIDGPGFSLTLPPHGYADVQIR